MTTRLLGIEHEATPMTCGNGIRVTDPDSLGAALRAGLEDASSPTVIDVAVTRDPARMLPAADNRTLQVRKGNHPA